MVSPNGTLVSAGGPGGNSDTIAALRSIQTFEDEKRGVIDADNYSVSLGLTTNVDQGFDFLAGTPDLQDSQVGGPGIETFSPWTIYDAFLALDREDKLTARLRIFHYAVDKEMGVPIIKERLLNNFPFFGDDMLRASGVGERAVQWSFANGPAQNAGGGPTPTPGNAAPAGGPPPARVLVEPANFVASLQIVAKEGWPFSQHSTSLNEDHIITGAFEKVNAVTPIANLRWSISHVPKIDEETLNRLKAIGAGVDPHSWSYMNGRKGAGPPFRMILDNGIHAGGGSDSAPAWSSAATTLDFLERLTVAKDPGAWVQFWNSRRGDIYLAIAVVLVLGVIRWGIWSNHSVSATGSPTVSAAHRRAAPDADLSLFDRILVELGLAEAPEPPVYKGNPRTQVWVDLNTALYYCPGADLYGKTPKGRFSSQRDAQLDQFEPAYRKACD